MKKKILFVVEYGLSSSNSVGQILRNILDNLNKDFFDSLVYVVNSHYKYLVFDQSFPNQIYFQNTKDTNTNLITIKQPIRVLFLNFLRKLTTSVHKGQTFLDNQIIISNLKIIRKKYRINFSLFLTFSPEKYSYKSRLNYSYFLYDTFLGRPGISNKMLDVERKVIKKSIKYYVAPFFYSEYARHYPNCYKIKSLPYPLFPDKKMIKQLYTETNLKCKYDFSYFGQLQSFRNVDEIFSIFEQLKLQVDVFSFEKPFKNSSVKYHNPLLNKEYFKAIAESKFLLVFDNNYPYAHYMPSKLYEFIAFGKPIIVFTKNKKSAAIDFLRDYKNSFIFDLAEKESLISFQNFISKSNNMHPLDDKIYDIYEKEYSSLNITKVIQDDFLSNT